jgi:nicotinamidase-related amidase
MDLERQSLGIGRRPAVIVVDMIRGFTDPSCPLGCESTTVVAANAALLEAARAKQLPIAFTTVIYRDSEQASVFRARVPALNLLFAGSPWTDVEPRLNRRSEEWLVEKRWASAFFDTDLAMRLRAAGADSLIVTGLTTSGCVRATVVDGLQHDFRVVVPREGVGDRNPDAHVANLHDMHAKYADVVSLDALLRDLKALD